MALPAIAPYPSSNLVRDTLSDTDWPTVLATYNGLLTHRLSLSPCTLRTDTTLHAFITSFFHELSHPTLSCPPTPEAKQLKQLTFLLVHRILTTPAECELPVSLLDGQFLLSLAVSLPKARAVRDTLSTLWINHHASLQDSISTFKSSIILPQLSPGKQALSSNDTQSLLNNLSILVLVSPRIGEVFIAGSDFLDALIDLYTSTAAPSLRKSILRTTQVALTSLLPAPLSASTADSPSPSRKPNYSLVVDHLYALQSHKPNSKEHTFLTALLSQTTFLHRLRSCTSTADDAPPRLISLIPLLSEKYTNNHPPRPRRKLTALSKGKGKGKPTDTDLSESLLQQLTLEVVDIFPELSPSWIRTTLTTLHGDIEALTRGVLDGTLYQSLSYPASGIPLVPTFPRAHQRRRSSLNPPHTPVLGSTPLPTRRNVHDNDDLDNLSTSVRSNLHIGKKERHIPEKDEAAKAAIYNALSVFDADDDERDDTYDVADVGGAVDTTGPEADVVLPAFGRSGHVQSGSITAAASAGNKQEAPEKILYTLWTTSTPPERSAIFARDSNTRRSPVRADVKRKTGWTDEAIEGWGVMLERDIAGRRLRDLERRYGVGSQQDGGGNLNRIGGEVGRRKWTKPGAEDDEQDGEGEGEGEGEDGQGGERGGYGYRGGRGGGGGGGGRGRGMGRGRGGGDFLGGDTQRDRARKEQNKSSRANHSRREGHARKMARGMGGVP